MTNQRWRHTGHSGARPQRAGFTLVGTPFFRQWPLPGGPSFSNPRFLPFLAQQKQQWVHFTETL